MVWVDREGRAETIIEEQRAFLVPRLSPDDRYLALDVDGATVSLWLRDLSRGTMTRLSFAFDNDSPTWAPDGERIAFASTRRGAWNLFWQPVDGSEEAVRLTTSEYDHWPQSWSPDGNMLAFQERHPRTGWDIWLLEMEPDRQTEPFLSSEFAEQEPRFSPNGRFIAYMSDESGRDEVYIREVLGGEGKRQVSVAGGATPAWNPDGRELFYLEGDRMMAVDARTDGNLTLGTPRALFEKRTVSSFDVSSDGQRFVMIEPGKTRAPVRHLNLVLKWPLELKRRLASTR